MSGGDQTVQYVDMGKGKESLQAHDELKDNLDPRNHASAFNTAEEPHACGGGSADRRETATVDG